MGGGSGRASGRGRRWSWGRVGWEGRGDGLRREDGTGVAGRWLRQGAPAGAQRTYGLREFRSVQPGWEVGAEGRRGGEDGGAGGGSDGRGGETGSGEKTARVWRADGSDKEHPLVLSGHTNSVNSAAFSPDGRWERKGVGEGKTVELGAGRMGGAGRRAPARRRHGCGGPMAPTRSTRWCSADIRTP